jgi:pimeloyl-ACP methyl ester carboxylesterase
LLAGALRAIQIEHRGHGRTNYPAGDLRYETIAADICAFIEQQGLAPAHLAGISDGGIIALQIGLSRPDLARTLIGVGANYCVDAQILAVVE